MVSLINPGRLKSQKIISWNKINPKLRSQYSWNILLHIVHLQYRYMYSTRVNPSRKWVEVGWLRTPFLGHHFTFHYHFSSQIQYGNANERAKVPQEPFFRGGLWNGAKNATSTVVFFIFYAIFYRLFKLSNSISNWTYFFRKWRKFKQTASSVSPLKQILKSIIVKIPAFLFRTVNIPSPSRPLPFERRDPCVPMCSIASNVLKRLFYVIDRYITLLNKIELFITL